MNLELSEKEIALLRKYTGYAHMKNAYPDNDFRMHITEKDLEISALIFDKLSDALGLKDNLDRQLNEALTRRTKGVPQE